MFKIKKSRVTQTPILSFPRAQRSVKGKKKEAEGERGGWNEMMRF
jgi:hypothetical protein